MDLPKISQFDPLATVKKASEKPRGPMLLLFRTHKRCVSSGSIKQHMFRTQKGRKFSCEWNLFSVHNASMHNFYTGYFKVEARHGSLSDSFCKGREKLGTFLTSALLFKAVGIFILNFFEGGQSTKEEVKKRSAALAISVAHFCVFLSTSFWKWGLENRGKMQRAKAKPSQKKNVSCPKYHNQKRTTTQTSSSSKKTSISPRNFT